jgi:hypothetical protein
MSAPPLIHELVERFERNYSAYKSGSYNETQVRREFIDPFFEALGWDVNNTQGYAEAYKDVIHEDAVKVGGITKAPDYSFRIGGTRKFFVEAKKPSIQIKDDPAPAFQVRRYAWSAKLPLSIVSDFEELAVYDCRVKPDQQDKADKARINYYTFRQYVDKWDEISAIFSRDAILKGSFDKYAESHKTKRGTSEVDSAFLEEIESWRDTLARNIALRNTLSVIELNEAVQRTIDRIIFLRIAEDRGIEEYGSLRGVCNGPNTFARLRELFYKADDRYNSGLFHFRHEKNQAEPPDSLTISLNIDDKPLKEILKRLYYPDSPYEFAVLPADILGQVYEQFLGKVIRLTSDHRAVVEGKPEVKKAGGVFYTPTYIVEYIVKNTVGKLLEGKTPKQAESIRVLDPACGSGSFLLGAYQFLLDWYLAWYVENDPDKWAKAKNPLISRATTPALLTTGEGYRLTTAERKRILLNNIYGVDIDSQAVEVTKLSLLLKVLEGETGETLNQQMRLFHERALPDLGDNIKCGNSLIDYRYCDNHQNLFAERDEAWRVNMMDWSSVFPDVLKQGGFDAIIGNPPYIRIQTMKEWAPTEVIFYKEHYRTADKGNYDIYVLFVEKGLALLNKTGRLGFILPHKFFNAQYGESLRGLIAEGKHISRITHFGHHQVFPGATTYTCLLFLDAWSNPAFTFTKVNDLEGWRQLLMPAPSVPKDSVSAVSSIGEPEIRYWTRVGISTTSTTIYDEGKISSDGISSVAWNFTVSPGAGLFERLNALPLTLGDVADIFVGLQTSADKVFIMDLVRECSHTFLLKSASLGQELELEKGLLKPLVSGTDVNRYVPLSERQYIIFPYLTHNGVVELISFQDIQRDYPNTAAYLQANRKTLEDREKGKVKDKGWYGYIYLKNMARQSTEKLCVPRLVERLYAAFDQTGSHYLDNVDVGGVTLKRGFQEQGLCYLMGLINSSLLRWFFPFVSAPFRGGWLSANRQFLSLLPIRPIDFTNTADKAIHGRIVQLVENMLSFHKQLSNAKTGHEQTRLQRQIDITDQQIDKLVYELYGLTEEEVAVVEGK